MPTSAPCLPAPMISVSLGDSAVFSLRAKLVFMFEHLASITASMGVSGTSIPPLRSTRVPSTLSTVAPSMNLTPLDSKKDCTFDMYLHRSDGVAWPCIPRSLHRCHVIGWLTLLRGPCSPSPSYGVSHMPPTASLRSTTRIALVSPSLIISWQRASPLKPAPITTTALPQASCRTAAKN